MRYSVIFLAGLCLSFVAHSAAADDRGWYIGIGFGDASTNYKITDFDDGSIGEGLVDNSDSAWKIFGGYDINGYFAIELGFADLHNDADRKTTFSGISNAAGSRFDSLPGGAVSVDIDDTTGYFIAAIGSLPLTSRFDLSAKAGVVAWRAQQMTVDLDRRGLALDGTDALIGIGMEYRFFNAIGIRGEVERYFNFGATDQDVAALSISYHF